MNSHWLPKVLGFDVDGVLTDGKYYVPDNGSVIKSFFTRDMWAINHIVKNTDIKVLIITQSADWCIYHKLSNMQLRAELEPGRGWVHTNSIVLRREVRDKLDTVNDILRDHTPFTLNDVAYMGDADNDLDLMKQVRLSACPADAVPIIQEESNYLSPFDGGNGAVYDFVTNLLNGNIII